MSDARPFYEDVQTIYDDTHSEPLLRLMLGDRMVYSCAYFERDNMSLAEAQTAKLDLSLGKCDLRPGMTLLDIGCGYGACACRAAEKHEVNVIGLTLSRSQAAHAAGRAKSLPPGAGRVEIRLAGWEEFDEPVDRVVSIGAFEHFRRERFDAFFSKCRRLLPADGRMLLHTIVLYDFQSLDERGVEITHDAVLFGKFMAKHIFPGGQLVDPCVIIAAAEAGGFRVEKQQSLQLHYARTLDTWAANLEARRDEAVRLKSQEDFDRFMKYLTGCAELFRTGYTDLFQFTLTCA